MQTLLKNLPGCYKKIKKNLATYKKFTWVRITCFNDCINVFLITSYNFVSLTRTFLAKFHVKWVIPTTDLKFCNLSHSYRSRAKLYCLWVNGATFQVILLHQPWAWVQWTQPELTQTKSPVKIIKEKFNYDEHSFSIF